MIEEIKKAVVPVAGLGTRFLPLSKVVPKEFWPLVEKPMIQYSLEELRDSGVKEVIFVLSPHSKNNILDYFKRSPNLERILQERKKEEALIELKRIEEIGRQILFYFVYQKKPLGDGHAILQAENLIGDEPFYVVYPDDIIESQRPASLQLFQIFKTTQKIVLGLYRVSKDRIPFYGIIKEEKIAHRFYKIKKIIEKPSLENAPSDLAILGRRILVPEIFFYLKKARPSIKKEIYLADVLAEMLKDGKIMYGYEIEGKWLECGDKISWLKSHLYLSLNHPQYGKKLREFLKKEINL